MTVRKQDRSISIFKNHVRLALQANEGNSDVLQLNAVTLDIAHYLVSKFELPSESVANLHEAVKMLCHYFDGAGAGRPRVLGYTSETELRKKIQLISAACKEALDHCRDLHDHLIFAQMQPAVMRLKSNSERLSQFVRLHRQADADLQRDLEAVRRVLTLVNSATARKPFPVLKKQIIAKSPAVWRVGRIIHNFWTKHVSPETNDTPSLCKGGRYLLFATDVYWLLGYPAGERGMIKRLKAVARRVEEDLAVPGERIPNIFGHDELLECAHVLAGVIAEDYDKVTEDEFDWLMSLPAILLMPRLARPPVPERAFRARNERSPIL